MTRSEHLTEEEQQRLIDLLRSSKNASEAARKMPCNPRTAWRYAALLKSRGERLFDHHKVSRLYGPKKVSPQPNHSPDASKMVAPDPPPAEQRRAVRDAAFWRARTREVEKELASAEHVAEQLAGVRGTPITVPDWVLRTDSGRRALSVVGALISDVHYGEVISADEINGINAFDPAICQARMRRYFDAVCIVGPRWASDTECVGLLVALAGDMISGDIHEELRITNALTSHEQVMGVVGMIEAGLRQCLTVYPAIHVVSVPGNHGRTTHKPTAKLYSRLSYDSLIADVLAQRFIGDDRVTFQYSAAKDQTTPVFNRPVLTTHGDKMGTRGGMGFAGPVLPIVRGAKKISEQQSSVGRRPYLIQHGHYHISANPGSVLSNGSVPGYSEYADDLRAVVEPPAQWLYLMHQKWGLRERATIQLEDPAIPPKPRVKMPARMALS